MKDPIQEIELRHKARMDWYIKKDPTEIGQVEIDVQNLLKLVKAYEEILDDLPSFDTTEIKKEIFGEK